MNRTSSIGVFDSGLGGLTVLQALKRQLPGESLIYFGDTARVPYGTKSAETVIHFSEQIVKFLLNRDVKMVVVACNTASSVALRKLQQMNEIPIIGVIEPGAKSAINTTQSNHIGVIGTTATIHSHSYTKVLKSINPEINVTEIPCPLFVPLVEEGWIDGSVPEMVAESYLAPFADKDVDTIILGCTHYPILKQIIKRALPDGVSLIDSADAVSIEVKSKLQELNLLAVETEKPHHLECFVTDLPQKFEELSRRFLGQELPDVKLVTGDW
ncbi:MAG: glutamate racemase [Candidatus Marinimicrobia bacterium]|nr:glutamate racemase [Candidatus Neomarinimicrobiota bacterium]